MSDEKTIRIDCDTDIVEARQYGRSLAGRMGFSSAEQALIATAISELARNIVAYASQGEIFVERVLDNQREGIAVTARDNGPGIPDISLAMQDGYSTSRGLGLGLPGTRRLMDQFDIISEVGKGTVITTTKWVRKWK